ncbi:hypothetical protein MLD38_016590 [Melastoma candidum]|uniref:Uncharacterized protein n=1 Tax=Melastoma candidum TaxID=119954 RepID=A0ACB9QRC3_9MYRT|nr:hypothetical protein MLD38_016590 [Melastoma candidum]
MGSGGSKAASSSSSSGKDKGKGKGKGKVVRSSSCLGLPSGSRRSSPPAHAVPAEDHEHLGEGNSDSSPDHADLDEPEAKVEFCRKRSLDMLSEGPHEVSMSGLCEDGRRTTNILTAGSRSMRASITQSLHPIGGFLSRFRFVPGNVSFRLGRANSLRSSSDRHASDAITVDNGDDFQLTGTATRGFLNIPESRQGYLEPAYTNRRDGHREPVERNVHYSRTLSVGRLRDRVLRRSSLSESVDCVLQLETDPTDDNENRQRQVRSNDARDLTSTGNSASSASTSGHSPSSMARNLFNSRDHDVDASQSRETRYRDLLEHRSDFLERRRRIRSQVRALQRLGSRFENLSGHERSCILAGQHRTGQCTCQSGNRHANSNEDNNSRASISRIVMLAEALFEVLDEIHQQSVVLSSRQPVSSIGSVPAPTEAVESLPLKSYTKLNNNQNEETTQCYICLLEYEDGDSMRILPCNHFFHQNCVDRWLKEIHRVCPLCRGDICKADLFSSPQGGC